MHSCAYSKFLLEVISLAVGCVQAAAIFHGNSACGNIWTSNLHICKSPVPFLSITNNTLNPHHPCVSTNACRFIAQPSSPPFSIPSHTFTLLYILIALFCYYFHSPTPTSFQVCFMNTNYIWLFFPKSFSRLSSVSAFIQSIRTDTCNFKKLLHTFPF